MVRPFGSTITPGQWISPNKGYGAPNPNAEFTGGTGEFGCTDFNLSAESFDRSTFIPLNIFFNSTTY
jgi:hypothetical protein